jgi:hypothetical protein
MMDFLSTFGIDLRKFAIQSLIFLAPVIWASIRVTRNRSGTRLPLWLLLIWIVPLFGPIIALVVVRKPESQNG